MALTIQCYESEENAYGPVHEQCNGIQWRSPRTTVVIYCKCWCHESEEDSGQG